jgi:hypothetical protein
MIASTRRFFARAAGSSEPSGFRFGATGRVSPNASVAIRFAGTPRSASSLATASTRFFDSVRLYAAVPTLSVWPSSLIVRLTARGLFSTWAIRSTACRACGSRSNRSNAKNVLGRVMTTPREVSVISVRPSVAPAPPARPTPWARSSDTSSWLVKGAGAGAAAPPDPVVARLAHPEPRRITIATIQPMRLMCRGSPLRGPLDPRARPGAPSGPTLGR